MKTTLLLLSVIMASAPALAAQPGQCGAGFDTWDLNCDGKIDGDEASASMQPFYDQQKRVSRPAHREGLPPPSEAGYPDHVESPGASGKWEKTNYVYGMSAVLLRNSPEGFACAPIGAFGAHQYEDCQHVGNGDYDCEMVYDYYECK
ncbi:hypothetical protein [Vibrio owensii]|uniref:hypothetical protein n=1 Tax=Vibrio owensii TaxID=696485 RepID=UPI003DA0DF6D